QLTLAMNGTPARRIPLARRHLQEVAAVEGKHRLYESFPEARRSNNECAIVILQRSGDDLRRRRGRSVDENDERNAQTKMWPASARDLGRRIARADADDLLSFLQKQPAHRERLIDYAAAVVAHVEHDSFRALLLE